jgi:hypothetical protein
MSLFHSPGARIQKALVLPLVLLLVVLLESIASYEVARHVTTRPLRVAILMLLYGVGFAVAGEWVTPWLKRVVVASRRTSHRQGGSAGAWVFFAAAYALLFYAFYLLDARGASALLPAPLR